MARRRRSRKSRNNRYRNSGRRNHRQLTQLVGDRL